MGYSEVLCHICGVSFNIGRIRTADEPRSAAWSRYSDGYVDGEANLADFKACTQGAGCQFVRRPRPFIRIRPNSSWSSQSNGQRRRTGYPGFNDEKLVYCETPVSDACFQQMDVEDGVDGDAEYIYESPEEGPLEYDSEYNSDTEVDGAVDEGDDHTRAESGDPMDLEEQDEPQTDPFREFWYHTLISTEDAKESLESDSSKCLSWHNGRPRWMGGDLHPRIAKDKMISIHPPLPEKDEMSTGEDDFSGDEAGAGSQRQQLETLAKTHAYLGRVEHIAGPGCQNQDGYNGHAITVEEMRGCTISQCLVCKPPAGAMMQYHPEPDDEEFERDGAYFLSGLCDHMPSRDMDYPIVFPPRHGCEEPYAENTMWEADRAHEYAMPFHPTCLEVYKRASQLHRLDGRVDMDGLAGWWTLEAGCDSFGETHDQMQDPAVIECTDQFWQHVAGTEWLAANPLFIPSLPGILQASIDTSPSFHPQNGAFQVPVPLSSSATDPFTALPHELRLELLSHLQSRDIANLRLASRSFQQLPISLFHSLLLREVPWLWEAWPADRQTPYSSWVNTTAAELKTLIENRDRALKDVQDYVTVVSQELPELVSFLREAATIHEQSIELEHHYARHKPIHTTPHTLPQSRTNWFTLYTLLTRPSHRSELKGLQNRRRIWQQCESILKRIDAHRDAGQEFPIQDVPAAIERRWHELRVRQQEAMAEERRVEQEREQEERQRREELE